MVRRFRGLTSSPDYEYNVYYTYWISTSRDMSTWKQPLKGFQRGETKLEAFSFLSDEQYSDEVQWINVITRLSQKYWMSGVHLIYMQTKIQLLIFKWYLLQGLTFKRFSNNSTLRNKQIVTEPSSGLVTLCKRCNIIILQASQSPCWAKPFYLCSVFKHWSAIRYNCVVISQYCKRCNLNAEQRRYKAIFKHWSASDPA